MLIVPFFCAATAHLPRASARFPAHIPRLYAADITGAAAGGLGSIGLLPALRLADRSAAHRLSRRWSGRRGARPPRPCGLRAGSCSGCRCWRPRIAVPVLLRRVLDRPAALALQGTERRSCRSRARGWWPRRSSPLGVVTAVESPQRPVPPRAGPEPRWPAPKPPPQLARVHRRRRPDRHQPLRRPLTSRWPTWTF
ncbi:MAG: hypothetical protein MZV65_48760 [Chromatiales bacterium]|nr:hypothetical protein [Chromatiales bacterium]